MQDIGEFSSGKDGGNGRKFFRFPRNRPLVGASAVPIPGTKTEDRFQQNMSAAYVEISDADWDKLEQGVSGILICGERYAPAMLKMTGQ